MNGIQSFFFVVVTVCRGIKSPTYSKQQELIDTVWVELFAVVF